MTIESLITELGTKPQGWISVNEMARQHEVRPEDVTALLAQIGREVRFDTGEAGLHFDLSTVRRMPTVFSRPANPRKFEHPYCYHGIGSTGPNGNGRGR